MLDTFCVLPFTHMHIKANGSCQVCCKFRGNISTGLSPMSVYRNTLQEIWNSDEMREIRRAMIDGRQVQGCMACYQEEAAGGHSARIHENMAWQSGWLNERSQTIDEVKTHAVLNDFRVPNAPISFQLDLGNACNLKCRMCIGSYSSRIDHDPVHGKWTVKGIETLHWRRDILRLMPQPVLGVQYRGFYQPEWHNGKEVVWTGGYTTVNVPIDSTDVVGLEIAVCEARPQSLPLRITVNRVVLYDGIPEPGPWCRGFTLDPSIRGPELTIELTSPTVRDALDRQVGFGIQRLEIRRHHSQEGPKVASTQCSDGKLWFQQPDFIRGELLPHPERLRYLNFLGGEPFLNKEIGAILHHLVDAGTTSQLSVQFTTNATVDGPPWLRLANHFKKLILTVSLDGISQYYDYIRYPATWDRVRRNLEALMRLPNTKLGVSVTFQAYNALNIVDLFRYLDSLEVEYYPNWVYFPEYLSPEVMPRRARLIAAARLRAYAPFAHSAEKRRRVLALADELGAARDPSQRRMQEFMLFTNDLDRTRGQDFRRTHTELFDLIREAGFLWTEETRHAQAALPPVTPAMSAPQYRDASRRSPQAYAYSSAWISPPTPQKPDDDSTG